MYYKDNDALLESTLSALKKMQFLYKPRSGSMCAAPADTIHGGQARSGKRTRLLQNNLQDGEILFEIETQRR